MRRDLTRTTCKNHQSEAGGVGAATRENRARARASTCRCHCAASRATLPACTRLPLAPPVIVTCVPRTRPAPSAARRVWPSALDPWPVGSLAQRSSRAWCSPPRAAMHVSRRATRARGSTPRGSMPLAPTRLVPTPPAATRGPAAPMPGSTPARSRSPMVRRRSANDSSESPRPAGLPGPRLPRNLRAR